ncbi:MAG: cysteine--tRNA ligase [Spirochaetales bacterium]|nr:cysteine--tRNA ligase [Spirochaetales bacterium]
MKVKMYNTDARKIEEFIPILPGKVSLYTCGPTVYSNAHIGNLRTYIFEDLLRRALEYADYEVRHVMNITDVGHLTDDADDGEDKMLKSSRESGRSVWDIAKFYTEAFFLDCEKLHINRPHVSCAATEHIDEMIGLVKRLEERGFTYEAGGNIYFSIDKFPGYGKMALLDKADLQSGARIAVDSNKKNPRDFVLWFTKSKFEHQTMMWDSPWGRGYPGWHLECSAMSMKYLGEQFDIHCGGVDAINVHHTNEIAQSEAAIGHKWVNYWMHGEFLLMKGGKMAKSTGNFITLGSLIEEGYDPMDYRYFCLGAHYRSQLIFSRDSLDGAKNARNNLFERIRRLKEESGPIPLKEIGAKGKAYLGDFQDHVANDLNMPMALSDMWTLIKDPEISSPEKLAILYDMDRIFGLEFEEIESVDLDEEILAIVREREAARKGRDFRRADEIRDLLASRGIHLEDTPDGTRWKKLV